MGLLIKFSCSWGLILKIKSSAFILSAAFVLVMWTPKISMAINRIVVSDSSLCSGVTSPAVCYTSAQTAITDALAATTSDNVEIRPGTYPVSNISISKNISIQGTETARTFLTGSGSTIITVSGVTNLMTIERLTFIDASVGIQINSGSALNIRNNVFEVGGSSTAIQVSDNTSTPLITNNVFYQNGTAVSSTSQNNVSIVNNIFSGNSFAISTNVALAGILNNLFFENTTIGPDIMFTSSDLAWKGNIKNSDPLFVNATDTDITKRDFHLKYDALNTNPCKNTGNTTAGSDTVDLSQADIGAYGGSNSDTIPFPISDLTITGAGVDSISLSWSVNKCYLIGGYNVYYGTTSGTYTGSFLNVGTVSGDTVTYTISGLASATSPTGILALTHTFASNTFQLAWDDSTILGATGYEIRYDATLSPPVPPLAPNPTTVVIDAMNAKSYTLGGLANGTYYFVQVTPYAQAAYYIAVKVYYAANTSYLSDYSNERNETIGTKAYDLTPSNVINDFPEPITPNPNLPNKGCFIATAAYGYYSAPQVQALREFRDRYLTTNAAGRAFVRWYYQHGPVGAQFINEHPWLKPVVRTALMPAVGGAMFMTRTSMFTKTIVFMFVGLLTIIRLRTLQKKGDAS